MLSGDMYSVGVRCMAIRCLTMLLHASPFLFVVEENFPFFEGNTIVFEVDAVEGA
jgi:hypothetical protein